MKRLVYFCLFFSFLWVFHPFLVRSQNIPVQNTLPNGGSGLTQEKVLAILKVASPHFNVSYLTLWDEYKKGKCLVIEVTPKAYRVTYGGLAISVMAGEL